MKHSWFEVKNEISIFVYIDFIFIHELYNTSTKIERNAKNSLLLSCVLCLVDLKRTYDIITTYPMATACVDDLLRNISTKYGLCITLLICVIYSISFFRLENSIKLNLLEVQNATEVLLSQTLCLLCKLQRSFQTGYMCTKPADSLQPGDVDTPCIQ